MKLKDFKEWLSKLPTEADEYDIVLGQIGQLNDDYYYRKDDQISALDLDIENKEVLIMRMAAPDEIEVNKENGIE
jgi:hypothetical protein